MKIKAFIYIVLAGILWGTSCIFVDVLKPMGFTSLQMTAARGIISFISMSTYALIYSLVKNKKGLFKFSPKNFLFFVPIGITLFSTAALYYSSITLTDSPATAVVLMYMAPIYVVIFSAIFLKEKLSALKICAVGAMFVGCALVSGIIGGLKFNLWGIILGFLSGVSYAIYNIITKVALKKNDAVFTTAWSFLFMAIIATSASNPGGIFKICNESPWPAIPLLIGLGIVTFVTPYFLYTLAMRDLPAGTASALGIVEPMAATVFSIIFLGKTLTALSVIGIVLILISVFALGMAESPKKSKRNIEQASPASNEQATRREKIDVK